MNYTPESLYAFSSAVLTAMGCDANETDVVASHLVKANLTGHDSHGVGMLPMYGEQLEDGNLVANQTPVFNDPVGAISIVDAKRGFGHRMALLALDHAMATVPEHKVAILGLRNAGHVSRVGTYSEYCASRGYVSIHMVNVVGHPPLVAPHGAREAGFSTNPISMAMPVDNQAKPMLDMATSTVAFGKVRVANNKGEKMPPGSIVDAEGVPTIDPAPMAERREGALSAFGGHKGSGLGLFVELLAGALVSEDTIASMDYLPRGVINNMFSVIIDPSAFDSADAVAQRTISFFDYIKNKPAAKGCEAVLMPGEPEKLSEATRQREGIPVDDATIQQIVDTSALFGCEKNVIRNLLKPV